MKEKIFYESLIIFILLALYYITIGNSLILKDGLIYFIMFSASSILLQIYVSRLKSKYPLVIFGMLHVYCILIILNFNFNNFVAQASIFILALSYGLLNLYIFKKGTDYILPFVLILIMIPLFIFLLPLYKAVYLYK